MASRADVVIVGGGIWGASAAYHLSRAKPQWNVVVVERNHQIALETTKQAAGQVGQLRSDPLMINAVRYTLEILERFQENGRYNPNFVKSGSLHLAQSEQRMRAFLEQLPNARQHGVEVDVVDASFIRSRAPGIDVRQIEGAIFVPHDGYVDAFAWAQALMSAAVESGVDLCLNAELRSIEIENERVKRIETSGGTIETERLVVTAGPWVARIMDAVAKPLPVVAIRLQQTRTNADPAQPKGHPVVRIPDQSCYLRPEQGGYLYGFFDPEPVAYSPPLDHTADVATDPSLYVESTRRLSPVFPNLKSLGVAQHRQGMVSCTPDAKYVIGCIPQLTGLCLATGCGAMGIAGSGAVGKWLANWAGEDDFGDDLSSLCPTRFADEWSDRNQLIDKCRNVFAGYYALQSATYRI